MARFIAIPVQGDAFYLERDGWSVLVDGGRGRLGFPLLFQNVVKANHVNVLVCTHNDSDHANGILGFLEAGLKCDQVWLPGRWLAALPGVLQPFAGMFAKLDADVAIAADRLPDISERPSASLLEAYANNGNLKADFKQSDCEDLGRDGWPESFIELIEQAEPWDDVPWPGFWHLKGFPRKAICRAHGVAGIQLLMSAIHAASRIRAIAITAFHRSIPVRWFEFAPCDPGGGEAELQPVNSRQMKTVRSNSGSLLDLLALTVSNKESLSFWSPSTDKLPGVLFTADSDLEGACLSMSLYGNLVTAPHHGSENNRNAYEEVKRIAQQAFNTISWVRSDGRYKSRPGSTYLSLPAQRFCTICRCGAGIFRPQQAVHFHSRRAKWKLQNNSIGCSCTCQ